MLAVTRRDFLTLLAAAIAAQPGLPLYAAEPLHRPIPRDGSLLPAIGLGTWQAFDFDVAGEPTATQDATQVLALLLAQPRRVIDSSPMYGRAEAALGQLLRSADAAGKAFVATKVWTRGQAEGRAQIEQSFRLLGRDVIDLFQVHNLLDQSVQLATLQALKREGRVRYVGVTHYTASAYAEVVRAIEGGTLDFVQINYSLAEREAARRVLPAAAANRVAVLVNRPFAEGAVFQRTRGKPLPDWAAALGCASWAQFALKYILAEPAVTCVIPGTRNPKHLADNLGAGLGSVPDAATAARMAAHFDGL